MNNGDFIPWNKLYPALMTNWDMGQHISIFGPTGSGKTTVLVELLEMPAHQPAVLFVTKKTDELITALGKRNERPWRVCRTIEETKRALKSVSAVERWSGEKEPTLILFWPKIETTSTEVRRKRLRVEGKKILDLAFNRGNMVLGIDEAYYVASQLRLGPTLTDIWHEGRSSGLSLLAASQRPSSLPLSAYSAPTYLFLFKTNTESDRKRYKDIGGGLNPKELDATVESLDPHEFVFAAPRDAPSWYVRSQVG